MVSLKRLLAYRFPRQTAAEQERAARDAAWAKFESEFLDVGDKGNAVSVFAECRKRFDAAWGDGWADGEPTAGQAALHYLNGKRSDEMLYCRRGVRAPHVWGKWVPMHDSPGNPCHDVTRYCSRCGAVETRNEYDGSWFARARPRVPISNDPGIEIIERAALAACKAAGYEWQEESDGTSYPIGKEWFDAVGVILRSLRVPVTGEDRIEAIQRRVIMDGLLNRSGDLLGVNP